MNYTLPLLSLLLVATLLPLQAAVPGRQFSPSVIRLAGTFTGFAYGSFPVRASHPQRSVYTDHFVIYVRPAAGKAETEVDCLHARWRVAGHRVPLSGALDALRQIDDGRHIILAVVTGVREKSRVLAHTVTLWQGRRRHPVEPIYNSAPAHQ